ncbi:MAG: hypothetical protein IKO49_03275 [Bacilli bacterium]|nr:hypothetical protein [Bacilli bacterium]
MLLEYKSEEKNLNPYQKASLLIQKKFNRDTKYTQYDMMETIEKAQSCLKQIDTIKTRSKIEMSEYGNTTTPAFLWQDQYVQKFYLFAVMVGFIDARIDDYKREIDFYSGFHSNETQQNVDNYKELLAKALLDREEVLSDYDSVFEEDSSVELPMKEVLSTCPSYKNFSKLYEDASKELTQLSIQQQLVSAYNIGYMDYYGDYEQKMSDYRCLYEDLKKHINDNKRLLITKGYYLLKKRKNQINGK